MPLDDVQAILEDVEETEDENNSETSSEQEATTEEPEQDTQSSDQDETELEDTVIDTSMGTSTDVDLSQFESEIYPYFVPEDARAKLLTMYMSNKQEEEKKNL